MEKSFSRTSSTARLSLVHGCQAPVTTVRKLRIHPETNILTQETTACILWVGLSASASSQLHMQDHIGLYMSIYVYIKSISWRHVCNTTNKRYQRQILPIPAPSRSHLLWQICGWRERRSTHKQWTRQRPSSPSRVQAMWEYIQHAQRSWLGVCEHRKLWRHQIHL